MSLILEDRRLEPLGPEQRRDPLEIVEERYGRGATLITSGSRSNDGMTGSVIPPSRMPSWTASFTTRNGSSRVAILFAKSRLRNRGSGSVRVSPIDSMSGRITSAAAAVPDPRRTFGILFVNRGSGRRAWKKNEYIKQCMMMCLLHWDNLHRRIASRKGEVIGQFINQ